MYLPCIPSGVSNSDMAKGLMSDSSVGNTHEVFATLFRAMDTKIVDRPAANLPRWADAFGASMP